MTAEHGHLDVVLIHCILIHCNYDALQPFPASVRLCGQGGPDLRADSYADSPWCACSMKRTRASVFTAGVGMSSSAGRLGMKSARLSIALAQAGLCAPSAIAVCTAQRNP